MPIFFPLTPPYYVFPGDCSAMSLAPTATSTALLENVSSFLLVALIVAVMNGALFPGSKDVFIIDPVNTVELIESGKALSIGSYLVIR